MVSYAEVSGRFQLCKTMKTEWFSEVFLLILEYKLNIRDQLINFFSRKRKMIDLMFYVWEKTFVIASLRCHLLVSYACFYYLFIFAFMYEWNKINEYIVQLWQYDKLVLLQKISCVLSFRCAIIVIILIASSHDVWHLTPWKISTVT